MTISRIGWAANQVDSNLSLTINRPPSWDFLLAILVSENNFTLNIPVGWDSLFSAAYDSNSSSVLIDVLARQGTLFGEPMAHTFTWPDAPTAHIGWILAYTGVDPADPVPQLLKVNPSETSGATGNHATSGSLSLTGGQWEVAAFGIEASDGPASWSNPSGGHLKIESRAVDLFAAMVSDSNGPASLPAASRTLTGPLGENAGFPTDNRLSVNVIMRLKPDPDGSSGGFTPGGEPDRAIARGRPAHQRVTFN